MRLSVVLPEQAAELREADVWQRAQAWRDWEKVRSGQMAEITRAELIAELEPSPPRRARRAPKRRK